MSNQAPIRHFDFKESLSTEIEVIDLKTIKANPELFNGHNKATFLQIVWIKSGILRIDIDFTPFQLHENEIFLISINQVYNFYSDTEFEGKLIIFTIDFFNLTELDNLLLGWSKLINPLYVNPIINISNDFILPCISLMEQQVKNKKTFYQPYILQSLLRILLLEIERILHNSSEEPKIQNNLRIGREFYQKVGENFKTHHNVSYYQDILGVSEKTLNKEVKEFTGKTPKEYLDSRIILEAKRLLAFGKRLSVKEVGIELGFDEPTNFNKFFKKNTGLTPKDFSNSSGDN